MNSNARNAINFTHRDLVEKYNKLDKKLDNVRTMSKDYSIILGFSCILIIASLVFLIAFSVYDGVKSPTFLISISVFIISLAILSFACVFDFKSSNKQDEEIKAIKVELDPIKSEIDKAVRDRYKEDLKKYYGMTFDNEYKIDSRYFDYEKYKIKDENDDVFVARINYDNTSEMHVEILEKLNIVKKKVKFVPPVAEDFKKDFDVIENLKNINE